MELSKPMELSKTFYKTKLDGYALTLDTTLGNQLSNIIKFKQLKFNDMIAKKLLEDESFIETLYIGANGYQDMIEFDFTKWFSESFDFEYVVSNIDNQSKITSLLKHIIECLSKFYKIEAKYRTNKENEVTLIMFIKEN